MAFLITLVTFILMEGATWIIHKYVMHGFLWFLHRDHHDHSNEGILEKTTTSLSYLLYQPSL